MTELKDVPLSVIQQELERRMREDDIAKELERKACATANPPVPLASPDFTVLRQVVERGVKEEIEQQDPDDDFKQYVYEAAMDAIYGPAYFEWRNKQEW